MIKAVFLDRDGTINVDYGYIYQKEQFEFLPNAIKALQLLQKEGFKLFIMTNQSGIARGYYSEKAYLELNRWMLEQLEGEGIHITQVYYCPHHPNAEVDIYRKRCDCRKPGLGMFRAAIKTYDIDLQKSFSIGDKIRDCEICRQTDCRGYLIGQTEKKEIIRSVKNGDVASVTYCKDLWQAAQKISQIPEREE